MFCTATGFLFCFVFFCFVFVFFFHKTSSPLSTREYLSIRLCRHRLKLLFVARDQGRIPILNGPKASKTMVFDRKSLHQKVNTHSLRGVSVPGVSVRSLLTRLCLNRSRLRHTRKHLNMCQCRYRLSKLFVTVNQRSSYTPFLGGLKTFRIVVAGRACFRLKSKGCLLACLTFQQHACVHQERICLVTDPLRLLYEMQRCDRNYRSKLAHPVTVYWHQANQSKYYPITPGSPQGSHYSTSFQITGVTRPANSSTGDRSRVRRSPGRRLPTRPPKR